MRLFSKGTDTFPKRIRNIYMKINSQTTYFQAYYQVSPSISPIHETYQIGIFPNDLQQKLDIFSSNHTFTQWIFVVQLKTFFFKLQGAEKSSISIRTKI